MYSFQKQSGENKSQFRRLIDGMIALMFLNLQGNMIEIQISKNIISLWQNYKY
jgi:hypothetical protein